MTGHAHLRATETMLAEAMLADLRVQAARVCWCKCTGCTTKKIKSANIQRESLSKTTCLTQVFFKSGE